MQPIRLPAYATPADVAFVAAGPAPARHAGIPFIQSATTAVGRARGGVLLIEAADLLSRATAAALRRTLAQIPVAERPLLIARSELHPSQWPLLADHCAFWVREMSGAFLHDRDGGATHEGTIKDRSKVALEPDLLDKVLAQVPIFPSNGHCIDRFVTRTAAALAARDDMLTIGTQHIERALDLVVAPRLPEAIPDDQSLDRLGQAAQRPRERSAQRPTAQPRELPRAPAHLPAREPMQSGSHDTSIHTGAKPSPQIASDDETIPSDPTSFEPPRVIVVPPGNLPEALSVTAQQGTQRRGRIVQRHRRRSLSPSLNGLIGATVTSYRRGHPLAVVSTLLAALPWQRLRQGEDGDKQHMLRLLPQDLRSRRRTPRRRMLYILAVDGSGSMAQGRMQLAKAAALAVLAGAYRERRYVALIDFRESEATLLCPSGRSSTTIRRLITSLPSGGGTPLPAGLALARDVARRWLHNNEGTARLVLFTDGKANVPLSVWDASAATPPTAANRRYAVREDIIWLAGQLNLFDIKVTVVDSGGWQHSSELHDLAALLDAAVVRTRSGICSGNRGQIAHSRDKSLYREQLLWGRMSIDR